MKKQIFIQPENEEYGDFNELDSGLVSWSEDKVSESDVQYFSKDYILSVLLARRRKLRQPGTPDEYKSHIIELDLVAKYFDIDLYLKDFEDEKDNN